MSLVEHTSNPDPVGISLISEGLSSYIPHQWDTKQLYPSSVRHQAVISLISEAPSSYIPHQWETKQLYPSSVRYQAVISLISEILSIIFFNMTKILTWHPQPQIPFDRNHTWLIYGWWHAFVVFTINNQDVFLQIL